MRSASASRAATSWITTAAGCADPTALWDEAAAAVGFAARPRQAPDAVPEQRTADQPGCAYALAEVGAGPSSGGRLYVRDALPSVIAHELGHNLGLEPLLGPAVRRQRSRPARCRTAGYRDYYDVMGVSWRQLGSLNAAQAAPARRAARRRQLRSLGVDDEPAAVDPGAAGRPHRAPGRSASPTPRAPPTGWSTAPPPAADAWLGRAATNPYRLETGVLLRRRGGVPRHLPAARRHPVPRPPAGTTTCRPRCPSACR